ncbi:LON peptidase substrate-binding domain-containing protein [Rhodopirellula sp. JC740]|uniref:LON peptidase substrate-binding domain-containing protein n=1 Tax=Rhodopirellula halodulae TaxID=2894198 RepID=A0ABS8NNG9_9BACT|nr:MULTISPECIES: LON peptidase substrate-binding domain-containing protein [unclassified Rhodopirellula]MCC9645132.1 LON peptidase substrate-binding domain-containing protein [Rhodopirellula sp. JC740]MCC9658675.1 LON peptidase substrate-binding domain-containing protein [Rhodopirellula sp. JC737]
MSFDSITGVTSLPDDFDGLVRLFPLPGLVLFPHAMQPLHVFEPRYVDMLREALATDQLVTMATLTTPQGSVAEDDAVPSKLPLNMLPPIASTVCIGKIISHAELDDDRHNILLVGIRRATVRHEIETGRPFRSARVDLIDDFYLPAATKKRSDLKKRLLEAFGKIIPASEGTQKSLHDLMAGQMGVGPITDIIAYTLPFAPDEKIRLLGMSDVDERAETLIRMIQRGGLDLQSVSVEEGNLDLADALQPRKEFPPPFSAN